MAKKVSCLNCIALLINLNEAWIDGERASLGKCIKKEFHIRETERYCKQHSSIDPKQMPHYLDYQRRKLINTEATLELIEAHASLNNQEVRREE